MLLILLATRPNLLAQNKFNSFFKENWSLLLFLYPLDSPLEIGRKTDANRAENFFLCFYIFLNKMGSVLEKTGLETESGYVNIRKQTNTDEEPGN